MTRDEALIDAMTAYFIRLSGWCQVCKDTDCYYPRTLRTNKFLARIRTLAA